MCRSSAAVLSLELNRRRSVEQTLRHLERTTDGPMLDRVDSGRRAAAHDAVLCATRLDIFGLMRAVVRLGLASTPIVCTERLCGCSGSALPWANATESALQYLANPHER